MTEILFLILALAALWLGSELVIKGALNIARHYKLSELFVGLTILAFGTDLPELFINVTAALAKLGGTDTSGLIVGNTIGSSLGQIGLVLGIVGFFALLRISKRELFRDGMMLIVSIVLLFFLSLDGELSKTDGYILIVIYLFYLGSLFYKEKIREKLLKPVKMDVLWAGLSLIAGFVILYFASGLTIKQALLISERYQITQSFIGILLVGLGTSLPELVTSISAVRRKAGKLAVGNLIGSTIFDILFTLGLGAAIAGFFVSKDLITFDIPALFVVALTAIILFATRKKLYRKEAAVLIGMYFVYMLIKVLGEFM